MSSDKSDSPSITAAMHDGRRISIQGERMTPRDELADLAIAAHDRLMQLLKSLSQQQKEQA